MKKQSAYIIRCAMICPDGTYLECLHRHDYKSYIDTVTEETYFIDGGEYYYRTSVNKVPAKMLIVTTDDPFELQRTIPFWKSYSKNAEYYPHGIRLSLEQMEDDHLSNILDTQHHIRGTPIQRMFLNELEYRGKLIKKEM